MTHKSQRHTADEFGKTGLSSASAIGAAGVIVDGLVERESGRAPGPFLSGTKLVIALVAFFLVSLTIMVTWTVMSAPEPLPAGSHPGLWIGRSSTRSFEEDAQFSFITDGDENDEATTWEARANEKTNFVIDGRTVSGDGLTEYLHDGMVRAEVVAQTEGVISRVEIVTPK